MVVAIVVIVVVVLAVGLVVLAYNRLVRLRNRTENAWAQVDVQLRKRYDLVPNLVETVKGYAAHERGVFEEVTEARARAQAAQGVEAQSKAETALGAALGRLFAVAEAYPDLKASASFTRRMRTVPPFSSFPNRISSVSGSRTSVWMTRASGRAP